MSDTTHDGGTTMAANDLRQGFADMRESISMRRKALSKSWKGSPTWLKWTAYGAMAVGVAILFLVVVSWAIGPGADSPKDTSRAVASTVPAPATVGSTDAPASGAITLETLAQEQKLLASSVIQVRKDQDATNAVVGAHHAQLQSITKDVSAAKNGLKTTPATSQSFHNVMEELRKTMAKPLTPLPPLANAN